MQQTNFDVNANATHNSAPKGIGSFQKNICTFLLWSHFLKRNTFIKKWWQVRFNLIFWIWEFDLNSDTPAEFQFQSYHACTDLHHMLYFTCWNQINSSRLLPPYFISNSTVKMILTRNYINTTQKLLRLNFGDLNHVIEDLELISIIVKH